MNFNGKGITLNRNDKLFFIIAAFLVLLMYILPEGFLQNETSVCIHFQFFGIKCPLCGLTRAAHALLHLDLVRAIKYNVGIIPLALLILNDILRRTTKIPVFSISGKVLWIIAALLFAGLYMFRIMVALGGNLSLPL